MPTNVQIIQISFPLKTNSFCFRIPPFSRGGYLITTAEGVGASFFEIFSVPATVELSAKNVDLMGAIHKYCAWGLMGIVILHAAAALFHHFIKRDKTLVRMLKPATLTPTDTTD